MTPLTPFQTGAAPAARGFIAKLFLRSKPGDARRAIVNRLAAGPPSGVTTAEIGEDLRRFGVRGKAARTLLMDVLRDALRAFLADDRITGDEAQYLTDLRRALGLADTEVKSVEEELVHPRFATAVEEAIRDDVLSETDREKLEKISQALRLPTTVADRILMNKRQDRLDAVAQSAIADQRLSPDELADLHALARSLNMELRIDDQTQDVFDRYKLLWRIENGQLPELTVPINLQRAETCHATADAIWMEMRTRTERYNYSGPVASIRICKGLRYRVGSVKVQRITREELTEVDRGRVYLTNKRVIFDGGKQNKTIRLSSLLSFTPFSDGVILEKASGRPPHLVLHGDVEVFLCVLGAVLAQSD